MPRAIIEEKLRSMQRKLSEIAEIPKILSSTLETVSQTFEKFIPDTENDLPDYENDIKQSCIQHNGELNLDYHFQPIDDDNNQSSEKESGTQDDLSNPDILLNDNDDGYKNKINNDDDEDEFFEADSLDGDFQKNFINHRIDSPESDYISEEEGNEEYCSPIEIAIKTKPVSILTILNDGKCMPELKSEEEQAEDDDGEQVEENEKLRTKIIEDPPKKEKNEKIDQLEKSWPWADRQKIIYRESTCHLVPRLSIVESRIKQLGGTSTLQFYERNRRSLNKSE